MAKSIITAKSIKTSRRTRRQYAAVPYRLTEDSRVEVLLVTSRDTGRWIIPKGWPIKGLKPATAAATEAFEEAGVRGHGQAEIGEFRYVKRMAFGKDRPCKVGVFPLRVTEQLDAWPEAAQRRRQWFSAEDAAGAVDEPDLKALLLKWTSTLVE